MNKRKPIKNQYEYLNSNALYDKDHLTDDEYAENKKLNLYVHQIQK